MEKTGFEKFIASRSAKISLFIFQLCVIGIIVVGNLNIYAMRHLAIENIPAPIRICTSAFIAFLAVVFVFLLLKEKLHLIPFLMILVLQIMTVFGVFFMQGLTFGSDSQRYEYETYDYRPYVSPSSYNSYRNW